MNIETTRRSIKQIEKDILNIEMGIEVMEENESDFDLEGILELKAKNKILYTELNAAERRNYGI